MRKIQVVLGFLFCWMLMSQAVYAQPTGSMSDSVARIYVDYLNLVQGQQRLEDSLQTIRDRYAQLWTSSQSVGSENTVLRDSLQRLKSAYVDMLRRLDGFNADLTNSLDQVKNLTERDLLSKESRLRNRKEKLIQTATFVRAARNSYDAIQAQIATSDYLNEVSQLNSPTNDDLGFSLKEEVVELVDQQIIKGSRRFNNKNPNKFLEVVDIIMDNPITTAVTTSVPAVSAIRAVVDLVVGISVQEEEVSPADVKAFKDSVMRYIHHYEALAQASYDFNSNLDKLKVRVNALGSVLDNYTIDRITTLTPDAMPPSGTDTDLNDLVYQHYERDRLDRRVAEILVGYTNKKGRVDYQAALNDPRMAYPLYVITQAQFIERELQAITNEYVAAYQLYHARLRTILADSKSLSRNPEKVETKRAELDDKVDLLMGTFLQNVKLRRVTRSLHDIPVY